MSDYIIKDKEGVDAVVPPLDMFNVFLDVDGFLKKKDSQNVVSLISDSLPSLSGVTDQRKIAIVNENGSDYELKHGLTSITQLPPIGFNLPFGDFDLKDGIGDTLENIPIVYSIINNGVEDFLKFVNTGTTRNLYLELYGYKRLVTEYTAIAGEKVAIFQEVNGDIVLQLLNKDIHKTKYSIKNIKELLHIHPADGNNDIFLENAVYEIDSNDFQLGVYNIKTNVPCAIIGISQAISTIASSEDNKILIESTSDLFLFNINLKADGLNSKAIVMNGTTGFESLDMKYVGFVGSTKYGSITGIRQGYWSDGFSFNAKEGFDLSDTIAGGFSLFNSRLINTGNYILKGNIGCTLGKIRSNVNCDIPSGAFAFDFDFEMFNQDSGYQLIGGTYNGSGKMCSDFTSGDKTLAERSRKSFFKENVGNLGVNTTIGGEWKLTTEALTPLTQNVSTKLLGTTTPNNEQHVTNLVSNAFTHNTTIDTNYFIDGRLVIDGGANDVLRLEIKRWNNLTSNFTVLETYRKNVENVLGGLDQADFRPYVGNVLMKFLDRIEMHIVNETDGTDVTLILDSFATLKKL